MIYRISTGYFSWNIMAWDSLFIFMSIVIILFSMAIMRRTGVDFSEEPLCEDNLKDLTDRKEIVDVVSENASEAYESWKYWSYFELAELMALAALFIIAVVSC